MTCLYIIRHWVRKFVRLALWLWYWFGHSLEVSTGFFAALEVRISVSLVFFRVCLSSCSKIIYKRLKNMVKVFIINFKMIIKYHF